MSAAQNPFQGRELEAAKDLVTRFADMKREIGKVIVGQEEVVDQLMIALLARGHCLLVGVPGLAKTLLIRTISEVLDLAAFGLVFLGAVLEVARVRRPSLKASQA